MNSILKKQLYLPFFLFLAIIAFFIISKSPRAKPVPPFQEKEYRESINTGDRHFAKMHLHGWREAGKAYNRAYGMKKTKEQREKLFLTLFLTAIRERDVKIVNRETYKQIAALGKFWQKENPTPRPRGKESAEKQFLEFGDADKVLMSSKKLHCLSGIIEHYRNAPLSWRGRGKLAAKHRQYVDASLFDLENSPLDAYLYLYCLGYYSFNFREQDEELIELMKHHRLYETMKKFSRTPLFIFNNIGMAVEKEAEIEKQYPGFAEFFQHRGNMEYDARHWAKAFSYYKKTLALIPDYTIALNGLGNIYFFTVHDYQKAYEYYATTLKIDDRNPAALFGEGVSLHHLERFGMSNMVFDYMLERQELHHGEAYYYKAYNHYLEGDLRSAGIWVGKAKATLNHSGEINFLSAMIHYKQKEMEAAELDFLMSLKDERFPQANSLYYLGLINLKAGNWIFFDYFEDARRALKRSFALREREIKRIGSLHIQEHLKHWMKKNRRRKLKAFKESAAGMASRMELAMGKNKKNRGNGNSAPLHHAAFKGKLDMVRRLLAEGAAIESRDRPGYTPLHRAVMAGRKDVAGYLMEQGAKVDTRMPSGYTPLHDAAYGGHKEIVEMLIARGAEIYAREEIGKTPLLLAADQKHTGLLNLLKPLHLAVEKGDLETVENMLAGNRDLLKAVDEKGRTPLYLSVVKRKETIARFLIEQGAEVKIDDRQGISLLRRARQAGFQELATLLTAKGAALTDEDMLAKEIAPGEAVLWFVGSGSWVVRTAGHALVFDYMPIYQRWRVQPDIPFIRDGALNPYKLAGKEVAYVVTHPRMMVPDSTISIWGRHFKNVTYFFSYRPVNTDESTPVKPAFYNMAAEKIKEIKGLKAQIFPTSKSKNAAFLVQVDGLTVFFCGGFTNRAEEAQQDYIRAIDRLSEQEQDIDLLFITVSGAGDSPLNRTVLHAVKKLAPGKVIPLHAGGDEFYYREFAQKFRDKENKAQVIYAERKGQRFYLSTD